MNLCKISSVRWLGRASDEETFSISGQGACSQFLPARAILTGILFILPLNRLCIRDQRPAEATTRKTELCLVLAGQQRGPKDSLGVVKSLFDETPNAIRWSSSPRPVNRLQATGEPLRRVMRGGSKGFKLGSKETDRPELP
jgi:hypothetical protein